MYLDDLVTVYLMQRKICSQGSAVEKASEGYKVLHEADGVLYTSKTSYCLQ